MKRRRKMFLVGISTILIVVVLLTLRQVKNIVWKTYTNVVYGYSIKYPGRWSINSENPALVYLDENRKNPPIFSQTIEITVYPNKGNLSAYQFIKDIFYAGGNVHDPSFANTKKGLGDTTMLTNEWLKLLKTTPVTIGGINMTKIDEINNLGGPYGPGYWISHNNDGYFILFNASLSDQDKTKEPDKVLSTFKFMEQ